MAAIPEIINLILTLLEKIKVGVGLITAKICQTFVRASYNQGSETHPLAPKLGVETDLC